MGVAELNEYIDNLMAESKPGAEAMTDLSPERLREVAEQATMGPPYGQMATDPAFVPWLIREYERLQKIEASLPVQEVTDAQVEAAAKAMEQRAKEPLGNIPSLEPVLVGSLGDAWPYLARAALIAARGVK